MMTDTIAPLLLVLASQRQASGDTGHTPLDTVAVKVSVSQMLTAPVATAHAPLTAHDFRYQADEIP